MSSHRWQPFNSKREAWVVLTCQEGTTKHPYEHKHTHAKRREHLMCLLFVRSNNLVVLLDKNNSPKCHQRNCVFRNSITNVIIIFANMKFLAKKFAIIIYLRKYNAFRQKQKNESPCEFPSVKQCVNLLSSAIDRRDALGIGSP